MRTMEFVGEFLRVVCVSVLMAQTGLTNAADLLPLRAIEKGND